MALRLSMLAEMMKPPPVTRERVRKLDTSKAAGTDDLNPKIFKNCASSLTLPICHLFTICMRSAKIPAQWKEHRIIPVFKSGDKSLIKNYRPISLLCILSKVLERIVYDQVMDHINYHEPR